MILVVGRPGLDEQDQLDRMAGKVALAAAEAGGSIEVVGSVGDDASGERVVLALGRAGIGHAAVLRDPAGTTPQVGGPGGPLPRLDEKDVDLGLSYLPECRVLVVAEPLGDGVLRVVREAANYHAAPLIVLSEPGTKFGGGGELETVLEVPDGDGGALAQLVGSYAVELAKGVEPGPAWRAAVEQVGWQPAEQDGEVAG